MGRAAKGGSHVPHLQRRHGTFHLRVRVPDDLRLRIGLREVRRSLRVHTFAEARPLALRYAARVMEVFDMLRTHELARAEVQALVQACFADLAAQVDDGFTPTSAAPELERDYQRAMTEVHTAEVERQLETGEFGQFVDSEALLVLSRAGVDPSQLAGERFTDLRTGVARALLERDRLFLFRMSERLLPYEPRDQLFQHRMPATRQSVDALAAPVLGPTLGEALDAYLAEGRRLWSPKTWRGRGRQLQHLREHLGADMPLGSISPQHIVTYRDALRRLRSRRMRLGGETFFAKQTDNEGARIADSTVENLFNPCKAFFRWAKGQQGLISVNPAEDVRLPKAKKPKGPKSRRPFTAEELKTLFAAPVFTGMKSPKRRFEPGAVVNKDAYYWIPILGYYTGARLGELVQLHLADVRLDGPIPHLVITEEGSAERGSGEEKMVKSNAGVRRVPLHSDVLSLGFDDFLRRRLKAKLPSRRLFWHIGYGADGQPSTVFSKWFARLMDRAGLTDPTLVFHSFRHTAEDACRNALLQQYVIDRVLGHAGGNTSDGYGEGISLDVAAQAVAKMQLPYRLVPSANEIATDPLRSTQCTP